MKMLPANSLEDLSGIHADPHVAVAMCYNYIIAASESPEEALLLSIEFGRLFVESSKWNRIQNHRRDFVPLAYALLTWVEEGLESLLQEAGPVKCTLIFQTYTLTSKGYCLELVLRDGSDPGTAATQKVLTKERWRSNAFDDVREHVSSSRPLNGNQFKLAFHAGYAVYVCYGRMLVDALEKVKPSTFPIRLANCSFFLDVNHPMHLGDSNPSGIWTKADPIEILNRTP